MTIFEKDNFDFLDKKTRQILLASRESFVPHTPYRYEKDMLEAVRIGDMDLAKQCMEALEKTGQAGMLSSSPHISPRSLRRVSMVTVERSMFTPRAMSWRRRSGK